MFGLQKGGSPLLGQIFNPENPFFRALGKCTDVVLLSLLWLVCCLPLFTIGPATAALYRVTVRCVRGGQNGPYAMFWETFKQNFKVGALASLAVLAAGAVLIAVWRALYIMGVGAADSFAGVVYYAFLIVLVLLLGVFSYPFPVLSRFTFRVGGLLSNSVKLAVAHLPTTLLLGILLTAAGLLCFWFFLAVFALPVLTALLQSLLLERIFRPYEQAQRE